MTIEINGKKRRFDRTEIGFLNSYLSERKNETSQFFCKEHLVEDEIAALSTRQQQQQEGHQFIYFKKKPQHADHTL